jgi:hypothetical protein
VPPAHAQPEMPYVRDSGFVYRVQSFCRQTLDSFLLRRIIDKQFFADGNIKANGVAEAIHVSISSLLSIGGWVEERVTSKQLHARAQCARVCARMNGRLRQTDGAGFRLRQGKPRDVRVFHLTNRYHGHADVGVIGPVACRSTCGRKHLSGGRKVTDGECCVNENRPPPKNGKESRPGTDHQSFQESPVLCEAEVEA